MKRKTAVLLICLSALLCWVLFTGALCAFSFVHLKTVLEQHCRTYFSYYLDDGRTQIEHPAQTIPTALAGLQNPVYPYFAALFGEDGSVLFRTGSCFVGAALDESFVVDLENELTRWCKAKKTGNLEPIKADPNGAAQKTAEDNADLAKAVEEQRGKNVVPFEKKAEPEPEHVQGEEIMPAPVPQVDESYRIEVRKTLAKPFSSFAGRYTDGCFA